MSYMAAPAFLFSLLGIIASIYLWHEADMFGDSKFELFIERALATVGSLATLMWIAITVYMLRH